jgi:hypothetical protein
MGSDATCIQSHLDEGYIRGSLMVNALLLVHQEHQLPYIYSPDRAADCLRRFMLTKLGLPA